jgi:2-keto-4-pentenoate hydratase/2-oxohepta-3-ene-1,7-dioic acid hydratase in catechol pathway
MKLLRHGARGHEKPGLLAPDGSIRDLSGLLEDIGPSQLSPSSLAALRAIDPRALPLVPQGVRLGAPLAGTRKFVAIGLNYTDHAAETGAAAPAEPIVFNKWSSCICGPDDDIVQPPQSTMLDWEVELGVVIGMQARHASPQEALSFVAGYLVVNDVSERDFQMRRPGGQWDKGKGFDTFGPIGPWLVTADEIEDVQNLALWLKVNGQTKQAGNTANMIFSCAALVSHCSHLMTLEPGDIITTGTPAGVGLGLKPPQFLSPGDVVELGITHLGSQRQKVVAP